MHSDELASNANACHSAEFGVLALVTLNLKISSHYKIRGILLSQRSDHPARDVSFFTRITCDDLVPSLTDKIRLTYKILNTVFDTVVLTSQHAITFCVNKLGSCCHQKES